MHYRGIHRFHAALEAAGRHATTSGSMAHSTLKDVSGMQQISLGKGPTSSRLIYGCMRIAGDGSDPALERGRRALQAALDAGFTTFDHADIYGGGRCEELFGGYLGKNNKLRDELTLITKCGIVFADDDGPKRYDSSAAHINAQVERSLARLRTERIDLLLLHRPDPLMEAEDVAAAFSALRTAGKVANFGVSNFSPSQVRLLQNACDVPLCVNQVEINFPRLDALYDGTLDQCQSRQMTPLAWSPLAGVVYPVEESRLSAACARSLEVELERQAHAAGVEPWVVALAWLLRHPAGIVPIVGSTTPERIAAATTALDRNVSRTDWYRLLEARNGSAVP